MGRNGVRTARGATIRRILGRSHMEVLPTPENGVQLEIVESADGTLLVRRRVRGEHAWAALGVAVVVYEVLAPPGELLSEAVDRFLERHPWATRATVGIVALHLLNLLPNKVDPIHRLATAFRH